MDTPRPGRWHPQRASAEPRRGSGYREPAPDALARPPLGVEESGSYVALREGWWPRLLRRLRRRRSVA